MKVNILNTPSQNPRFNNPLQGENFLGVDRETFACIRENLYKRDSKPWWQPGEGDGFDCRSFTAAAINFLKEQLSGVCPDAVITYLPVRKPDSRKGHAIVSVTNPPGDPCCSSFYYEPLNGMSGTLEEIGLPGYSPYVNSENPEGGSVEPPWGKDPWGNPGWPQNEQSLNRIQDAICGCIEDAISGSMESVIQNKCNNNTFKDWFKEEFSPEGQKGKPPRSGNKPIADMPQILSCKKQSCSEECECTDCVGSNAGCVNPHRCKLVCSCESNTECCTPTPTPTPSFTPDTPTPTITITPTPPETYNVSMLFVTPTPYKG